MASNPMQKKVRNSFLLGMIIAIICCLMIGALAYFLLIAPKSKEVDERGVEKIAYVLNQDVKSGQVITDSMLTQIKVYSGMIPADAFPTVDPEDGFTIEDFETEDIEGNVIYKTNEENEKDRKYYIIKEENKEYETISDKKEDKNKVLIEFTDINGVEHCVRTKKNGDKEYFKTNKVPVIAKVDLSKNTILTSNVVTKSDEKTTDDLRYVEYNMITLPTTADIGSVIDIRLTLPNGLDLVVISKKEIKSIIGNTIRLKLTEEEILMMESAIVEAYIMKASKLYATEYTEAGNQNAALNTYVPTDEVQKLIMASGNNIQETAKNALANRFDSSTRNNIDNDRNKYYDSQLQNIETELQEEIENAKAAREAYLNGLTSY